MKHHRAPEPETVRRWWVSFGGSVEVVAKDADEAQKIASTLAHCYAWTTARPILPDNLVGRGKEER